MGSAAKTLKSVSKYEEAVVSVEAAAGKLVGRHELTDDQWGIIRDLLSVKPDGRGRPSKNGDLQFINAVF